MLTLSPFRLVRSHINLVKFFSKMSDLRRLQHQNILLEQIYPTSEEEKSIFNKISQIYSSESNKKTF